MNRGPGDEEKVGYQKTSNFPSIGVFTVSPRPWELTDCLLPCTRSPHHHHSPGQALSFPFSPEWDLSYCLSICQQWEWPNQDAPLLPLLAQEPHGGLVMLRDASHQCPGPASPFVTVSFKDREKEHEISKSQGIFSFIFPKEMDMESTPGQCGCAASGSRQRKKCGENLNLPCIPQARQAWITHP